MIDLHCHILPQLDDGPDTLIESLMMAKEAAAQGISRILCTPHHNIGKYWNPKNKVIMAVAEFQKLLDENKIPITLYEGQEIRISGDLYDQVQKINFYLLMRGINIYSLSFQQRQSQFILKNSL
ncbi:MAG: CpsB/CapC family capsule biosynthesis tyrosine phosphatase [Vagococcus salmoninarum]|uniref:CpsB/CapC family capsule biosynthesis tyrosine phosphatase n=1 Tax=Vagococcus salmoninarum TaxID=2739 RepID=UPI003F97F44D